MQIRGLKSYDQEQLDFEQWLLSPLGQSLLAAENHEIASHLKHCFGVYRVHVGPGADTSVQLSANMPRTILLGAHAGMDTQVIMDPHNLPLANDSVQALVIQHVFDIAQDPHDMLREAARVVMPGGRMIICGFNPYSSWGMWRAMRMHRGYPWQYRFLSAQRLQDWLSLLNFKVVECGRSFYRLPINNHKWLQRTVKMERFGQGLVKRFGAVYVMSAIKQETRLRNHKPSWRAKIRRPQLGLAKVDGQVRSRQK
ncbi:MAG TPA: hypothetical protein DE179_11880 [Oceanospirillaceae bacterium]|nr:hypothetical protein [Oceanospirillaceae bacterium]